MVDPWNNDERMSHLLNHAKVSQEAPHILILTGQKDRTIPEWHTQHLWKLMEATHPKENRKQIIKKHIFKDGRHALFDQHHYHEEIRLFLEEIFNQDLKV